MDHIQKLVVFQLNFIFFDLVLEFCDPFAEGLILLFNYFFELLKLLDFILLVLDNVELVLDVKILFLDSDVNQYLVICDLFEFLLSHLEFVSEFSEFKIFLFVLESCTDAFLALILYSRESLCFSLLEKPVAELAYLSKMSIISIIVARVEKCLLAFI